MTTRQQRDAVGVARYTGGVAVALAGAAGLASVLVFGLPHRLDAQQISSGGWKPFVIAVIPVVGRNGAVGGVSIDAGGVVNRSSRETTGQLRRAWLAAMVPADGEMARASSLRKISLRRLEAAMAACRARNQPLPLDMRFLAGLQRVRYVFAYPEAKDVVLAGEAEGWLVDDAGEVVGQTSGQPVVQLDDLMIALRTAPAAAAGPGVTCSIDPTEEGLARFDRLMRSQDIAMGEAAIRRLERTLGKSVITVTGVEADTHFAQVLVAADFRMKRLALGFEPAPLNDLPSYLQMLQSGDQSPPPNAIFRLWLAPKYDAVLRDTDGLAWELVGDGVQTLTEAGLLAGPGRAADAGAADPLARAWADTFTDRYGELAAKLPVFASLRNCIDLAVVGAIAAKEQWLSRTGLDESPLVDARQADVARYPAPRSTPTRASFVPRGSEYIVSLSGGVDLDSWSVLKQAKVRSTLTALRTSSSPPKSNAWWWD